MECVAYVFDQLSKDDQATLAELLRTRAESEELPGTSRHADGCSAWQLGTVGATKCPKPEMTA
jgi:hypothetical protein